MHDAPPPSFTVTPPSHQRHHTGHSGAPTSLDSHSTPGQLEQRPHTHVSNTCALHSRPSAVGVQGARSLAGGSGGCRQSPVGGPRVFTRLRSPSYTVRRVFQSRAFQTPGGPFSQSVDSHTHTQRHLVLVPARSPLLGSTDGDVCRVSGRSNPVATHQGDPAGVFGSTAAAAAVDTATAAAAAAAAAVVAVVAAVAAAVVAAVAVAAVTDPLPPSSVGPRAAGPRPARGSTSNTETG